jgi:hypothetical protein
MRCDSCQHWADHADEWDAKEVGFRRCQAVRERWVIQDEAPKWSPVGVEEHRDKFDHYQKIRNDVLRAARAYVQDGSEYHAELITGPDFFCAFWTQRS